MIRIVTKKEFSEMFDYKHVSSVSHLIADGKIEADENGMINLDSKKNKKWVKAKEKELAKKAQEPPAEPETPSKQEAEGNIGLEIQILNEKLNERQKKTTLLDLKIAKERKEVVETEVLNRVIMTVFDTLFKNLAELPSIYVDDIVGMIKSSKTPKETVVKFLTDKIISHIRSSLDVAENTAKKYYE